MQGILQNYLTFARQFWKETVQAGDCVLDATCGNGYDTCFLRELVGDEGQVFGFDMQIQALQKTSQLLLNSFDAQQLQNVCLIEANHLSFPPEIAAAQVKLIVYNLGYLPGGDKSIITKWETTLQSVQAASHIIAEGGMISITCYSGHAGGDIEEQAILDWASELDSRYWICCHHRWINRKKAASLLLITKKKADEKNRC